MDLDDRAEPVPVPVRDRAGQFRPRSRGMAEAGIEVVKIPPRCPRANCFAERLVLTVRTELTDRMLIFSERTPSQGACRRTPRTTTPSGRTGRCSCVRHARQSPVPEPVHGRIRRRPILGGLINEYGPAA